MRFLKEYNEIGDFQNLSEGLEYHINKQIPLMESVYRIESSSWISLVNEARDLWEKSVIDLNDDDLFLISTDAGTYGVYEGNLVLLDVPFWEGEFDYEWDLEDEVNEAEYHGKKVSLGKISRGDVKKYKVYVKNGKGNVVKVNFGDPNMKIKRDNPKRRKNFRARHHCENPGPRWKARYWACRTWSRTPVSKMV